MSTAWIATHPQPRAAELRQARWSHALGSGYGHPGDPRRGTDEALRRHARSRRARPDRRAWRGVRLSRPERRRQDDDDPAPARAAPAHGRSRLCSGWTPGATRWRTAGSRTSRASRAVAVADGRGDARVPRAAARRHGRAYREELVERFELDPAKKVRALSKGNRQKVQLDRRARDARRPARPRRADQRPRPADGGRVPETRARGEGARPDGLPLLAHPERGRGAVRSRRHSAPRAARRRGDARRAAAPERADVEVTFAGPAPELPPSPACGRAARRERAALRGDRQRRAAARRARRAPVVVARRAASRRSRRSSSTTTTATTA